MCSTHGYHVAFKKVQVKGELAVKSHMNHILPSVIFVEKFQTCKSWHKRGNASLYHVTE